MKQRTSSGQIWGWLSKQTKQLPSCHLQSCCEMQLHSHCAEAWLFAFTSPKTGDSISRLAHVTWMMQSNEFHFKLPCLVASSIIVECLSHSIQMQNQDQLWLPIHFQTWNASTSSVIGGLSPLQHLPVSSNCPTQSFFTARCFS